ncbi:MAG: NAD(P)-dependent oxidoreductase [Acidimicrobiales bacterium]|nr:NAD(P)-dependent oxidoreductase [Acidimicrobiales bacterium]
MGASIGAVLAERGHSVLWASKGRSPLTAARAQAANLTDAGDVTAVVERSEIVMSICPPHAALEVAQQVTGNEVTFVDANAISPQHSQEVGALIERGGGRFVDGGIVGPPARPGGRTRLFLAGTEAAEIAELFGEGPVVACVMGERVGDASAVKMAYAAWTKGTSALILAIRAMARANGVDEALLEEWRSSSGEQLPDQCRRAAQQAATKGWRWVGEMEEIASSFAAAGLPDGFHLAAARTFGLAPRMESAAANDEILERVLAELGGTSAGVL